MINDDFYVVSLLLVTTILDNVIIWRKALHSPINEPKILGLSFLSFLISIFCILLSILLINDEIISYTALTIFRVSFLFIQLSSVLIVASFFLPEAKRSYLSFFIISLIITVNSISAYINTTELKLELIDGSVQNILSMSGIFFLALSGIILVSFIFVRYIQVANIIKQNNLAPVDGLRPTSIVHSRVFGLIIIVTIYLVLTFIEILIAHVLDIRNISWLVLLTLNYLFFTIILTKDFALFFITPVKLEAILIIDQETGLALYSKTFLGGDGTHDVDVFAGLFTALNLSLKDMIKSKKSIEQLSFGDKVIILASGIWTTSLLIVSEHNFSTSAIAKYLTLKFEKTFRYTGVPVKSIEPTKMEPIVKKIREYLPL